MSSTIDLQSFTHRRSWFLGIGIDRYVHFPNLQNAVRDVRSIYQLLIDKYDVSTDLSMLLINEDATEVNILQQFDRLSNEMGKDDKLIIYYSGHGHLNPKTELGYWIPQDAEPGKSATYILNSTIRDYIKVIPSHHTLLISDSCFSGSLFSRGASRAIWPEDKLDNIRSRWALCSGRHDEKVYDGEPGQNSPFTASVLKFLNGHAEGALSIGELAYYVIEQTASNYEQLPEGNPLFGVGHEGGQYIFRLKDELQQTSGQIIREQSPETLESETSHSSVRATNETVSADKSKKRIRPMMILIVIGLIATLFLWKFGGSSSDKSINDVDGFEYRVIENNGLLWTRSDLNFRVGNATPLHGSEQFKRLNQLGLLYPFESAQQACQKAFGREWRLPTTREWVDLASNYGTLNTQKMNTKYWSGGTAIGNALFLKGESNLDLTLNGFYLPNRGEFSPQSELDQINNGYYWTAEKGRVTLARQNQLITIEILGSAVQWDHGYSCRCVRTR